MAWTAEDGDQNRALVNVEGFVSALMNLGVL
jgi:hypothetical protein